MKKILLAICLLMISSSVVLAAEQYSAELYKKDTNYNNARFNLLYSKLNGGIAASKQLNGKSYTNFNDIWNYGIKSNFDYDTIPNGLALKSGYNADIKYTKLKDICSPAPAKPTPQTACAKLIVDVNGFSKGNNKLFSDKTTLLAKDQYVLYLYSDAIRPAAGSMEDILLFMLNPQQTGTNLDQ